MDKNRILLVVIVIAAVIALLAGHGALSVLVAALGAWLIFRVGWMMLGGLARPIPEPPPAGELRKVKIAYRCAICGTEVRMTVAPDQDPEPPRHCQEDMDLVAPID
ncbi:MAG: hypothetical protein MUF83_06915 [Acidimicrobiales bacterium]|jgi:DNA-directed RNA polymerase subunit RPC12/RpoP|nr:hypothetical protein [Acidimicrobiales bacterium]